MSSSSSACRSERWRSDFELQSDQINQIRSIRLDHSNKLNQINQIRSITSIRSDQSEQQDAPGGAFALELLLELLDARLQLLDLALQFGDLALGVFKARALSMQLALLAANVYYLSCE